MKIFWWQDGLHIVPEGKDEFSALMTIYSSLNRADFSDGVITSVTEESDDQEPVTLMDERSEAVSDGDRAAAALPNPLG